jgi:hypothetical protein
VSQTLNFAIAVTAFLGIYAVLRQRHAGRSGTPEPVQWGWIAAAIAVAAVAMLASALLG